MTLDSDKRRFKRVDYSIEVVLEVDGDRKVYLQTRDINMRGLFVETDEPLSVGTAGQLEIHLQLGSQSEQVCASFRVVRSQRSESGQPGGMGLEFTEIDSDSSITLFNMVKSHGGFENI